VDLRHIDVSSGAGAFTTRPATCQQPHIGRATSTAAIDERQAMGGLLHERSVPSPTVATSPDLATNLSGDSPDDSYGGGGGGGGGSFCMSAALSDVQEGSQMTAGVQEPPPRPKRSKRTEC
jgi:hypothetical protein